MNRRIGISLRLLVLLALVFGVGGFSSGVRAQSGGPDVKVVATGLDNPRGMTFGPDGALYVAESGRGGQNCIEVEVEGETRMACLGLSGAVTRIARGHQVRIARGLPSWADSEEGMAATGPNDVAFTLQGIRVVIGLGGNLTLRDQFPREYQVLGTMVQLLAARRLKPLVDLVAFEEEYNPEPTAVDSNPYSVLNHGSKGIVADAGGNALLEVEKNGKIKVLATFPPKIVDIPPGFPIPLPPQFPMDIVPNSVVIGPDGAYYVGQLGGFPFLPGESDVFRVKAGQAPEVYAEGFTSIIDIAFDKKGNLYVLEIAAAGLLAAEQGGDFTGALYKVAKDGTRTLVMQEGLTAPTGMVIAPNGDIYVANMGVFAGQGEVLRIRP